MQVQRVHATGLAEFGATTGEGFGVLEAPAHRMAGERSDWMSQVLSGTCFIDLRRAAASDAREARIADSLDSLHEAAKAGLTIELAWPTDRDASIAAALLGAPLAMLVANCMSHTSGSLVIHTRTGAPAEFLTMPVSEHISFVVHLNSEEAAMRWERQDAAVGKRIAAAVRLRAAGWQVWVCIGPVRCFSGWRDEYSDVVARVKAAGFRKLLVSFPGEDALECQSADDRVKIDYTGLEALTNGGAVVMTVSPARRAEVFSLLELAA
jgi:hypothetical protein